MSCWHDAIVQQSDAKILYFYCIRLVNTDTVNASVKCDSFGCQYSDCNKSSMYAFTQLCAVCSVSLCHMSYFMLV